MKYIRDIYSRFAVLIHEIAKFAIVGGLGFVVQLGVTDGLHLGVGTGPVTATFIGYVVSAAVTFLGNRHWAFKHRQGKGLRHETLMFVFLNAIALGIQEAVVAIVHYGLHDTGGIAFNVATILGIGLGTLFRLWSYRKFVFLAVDDAPSIAEQVKPVITGENPVIREEYEASYEASEDRNGQEPAGVGAGHTARHRRADYEDTRP